MILNRLYELAVRESLLDDPAFETLPVPFVMVVGDGGKFLAFEDHHGTKTITANKKGVADKTVKGDGDPTPVPRAHGNKASQGFARYFVDTLARVLPITDDATSARSRKTFWEQIDRAAEATDDPALRAVQAFGRSLTDAMVAEQIRAAVAEKEPAKSDRVVFSYSGDGGQVVVRRDAVRSWYRQFYDAYLTAKQAGKPKKKAMGGAKGLTEGFCTITGTVSSLPESHSIDLQRVPGGLAKGVKIVSFDKAAFEHYGLKKAANAAIGYTAADGYARAFQHLRATRGHHVVIGGTLLLFWTREKVDTSAVMSVYEPDEGDVEKLLTDWQAGKFNAVVDENKFYLLAVTGNAARAVIRDFLERKLVEVKANLAQWFNDLAVADTSEQYSGKANRCYSLLRLAASTVPTKGGQKLDWSKLSPNLLTQLTHAAIHGRALPDSVLAACVGRIRAEGSKGFRAPRMALIRLSLNRFQPRGGPFMTEQVNDDERHPAYVYGRLLRLYEELQRAALGKVNATVVDKFYGTFAAAPALIFSRLADNAQHHMARLRKERPKVAYRLDEKLAVLMKRLPPAAPQGTLSLADQGRFALGYYHQKAETLAEIAERKRLRDAKNESPPANKE